LIPTKKPHSSTPIQITFDVLDQRKKKEMQHGIPVPHFLDLWEDGLPELPSTLAIEGKATQDYQDN